MPLSLRTYSRAICSGTDLVRRVPRGTYFASRTADQARPLFLFEGKGIVPVVRLSIEERAYKPIVAGDYCPGCSSPVAIGIHCNQQHVVVHLV